ncbi:hypothetical protein PVAP13_9NG592314 [Panicum virgatum]|uniref:Uncharacterized protein n=1 Tax=Panicum virgatum TaxID=38727 RepID=A0A8T0MU16_PANVG|nr:hypothetical protein PVAP13_9NG592314 [Panicum virgatum]
MGEGGRTDEEGPTGELTAAALEEGGREVEELLLPRRRTGELQAVVDRRTAVLGRGRGRWDVRQEGPSPPSSRAAAMGRAASAHSYSARRGRRREGRAPARRRAAFAAGSPPRRTQHCREQRRGGAPDLSHDWPAPIPRGREEGELAVGCRKPSQIPHDVAARRSHGRRRARPSAPHPPAASTSASAATPRMRTTELDEGRCEELRWRERE